MEGLVVKQGKTSMDLDLSRSSTSTKQYTHHAVDIGTHHLYVSDVASR